MPGVSTFGATGVAPQAASAKAMQFKPTRLTATRLAPNHRAFEVKIMDRAPRFEPESRRRLREQEIAVEEFFEARPHSAASA
jgi:hypothetical protein